MTEIGEGVFLNIAPGEKNLFWSIITESGYTPDAAGVKQFILDSTETDDGPYGSRLVELIEDNPELAQLVKGVGSHLVKRVLKKIL